MPISAMAIILGFEFLLFGCFFVPEIREVKRWKKIEEEGIRVAGQVVGCYIDRVRYSSQRDVNSVLFYLTIEYFSPISHKVESYFEKKFDFDPINYLGSKECSVYITKTGEVLGTTDFIKRKKGQEKIWTEKQIKDYNAIGHMNYEHLKMF